MIADRANRHAFALCWLPPGFLGTYSLPLVSSLQVLSPMTKGLCATGVWNLAAASQRKSGLLLLDKAG